MLTCGNEDIPLDLGPNNLVEKENWWEKERKEREMREKKKVKREVPPYL